MKKAFLLLSLIILYSCSNSTDTLTTDDSSEKVTLTAQELLSIAYDNPKELSESEAIDLITQFDSQEKLKINSLRSSKPISLKKTNQYYLKDNLKLRSSSNNEHSAIPIYEFEMNDGENLGCAIVCADERYPEVLAFVPKGTIRDTVFNKGFAEMVSNCKEVAKNNVAYIDHLKDSLRDLTINKISKKLNIKKEDVKYDQVIHHIDVIGESQLETRADKITEKYIGPLTKTAWNQNAPYNNDCPTGCASGHMYAGCVAIALAQTIAYYETQDSDNPSYFYDYPSMKNYSYVLDYGNSAVQVAKLVKRIGDICHMQYGCGGSTSSLENYGNKTLDIFNLNAGWKRIAGSRTEASDLDFIERMQLSLNRGRLILMRGANEDSEGHAWIIDGMKIVTKIPVRGAKEVHYYVTCNLGWGTPSSLSGYYAYGSTRYNPEALFVEGFLRDQFLLINIRVKD